MISSGISESRILVRSRLGTTVLWVSSSQANARPLMHSYGLIIDFNKFDWQYYKLYRRGALQRLSLYSSPRRQSAREGMRWGQFHSLPVRSTSPNLPETAKWCMVRSLPKHIAMALKLFIFLIVLSAVLLAAEGTPASTKGSVIPSQDILKSLGKEFPHVPIPNGLYVSGSPRERRAQDCGFS